VYVTHPHSGHLAQKFQPFLEGPFTVITQKSHNNYLLQDCVKANRTRSVHVNLIKHGTFKEQLFDETAYTPLTDLEPLQQPKDLLSTLENLKSTQARNAHSHIYDNNCVFLQDPAAAAAAAAAAAGNRLIQGQAFQGQHIQLPAVQIPLPALQKEERPLVESTSESDDNEFENALDRTIIQKSDEENETPPTRTPPPSPSRPRRRRTSPTPSPAAGATGAQPRTRNQTHKDGDKLGKLTFRRERKKYETRKK
jgi:hypothetical protein